MADYRDPDVRCADGIERMARAIYERIVYAGEDVATVLRDYLPRGGALADTQRAIIEAAERRGYERAREDLAERDEALLRQALDRLEAVVGRFDPYIGDNECRPMENARSTITALRERLGKVDPRPAPGRPDRDL